MKHLAVIQIEFLKQARKWDDLTLEQQKEYLKKHPKTKKRITARSDKGKSSDLAEVFDAKKMHKHGFEFDYKGQSFLYLNKVGFTDQPVIAVVDKKTKKYLITYDLSIVKSKNKAADEIKKLADGLIEGQSKGKTKEKFQEGQKVNLKPNKKEGWSRESGNIVSVDTHSGTAVVQLHKKYYTSKDDDGIREVGLNQIE